MRIHYVRSYDTLERLSALYHIPICMIVKANGKQTAIRQGEKIMIPGADFCRMKDSTPAGDMIKTLVRHQVKSGQTLLDICKRYNTTIYLILEQNRISPEDIRPGRMLNIPILGDAYQVHTAKMGDSADRIAMQYHMDKKLLFQLNSLVKDTDIYQGRQVIVKPQATGQGNT